MDKHSPWWTIFFSFFCNSPTDPLASSNLLQFHWVPIYTAINIINIKHTNLLSATMLGPSNCCQPPPHSGSLACILTTGGELHPPREWEKSRDPGEGAELWYHQPGEGEDPGRHLQERPTLPPPKSFRHGPGYKSLSCHTKIMWKKWASLLTGTFLFTFHVFLHVFACW